MALLNFMPSSWKKKLLQAFYKYEIHSGQANIMPDNPNAYINQGYAGNTTVYSIIDRVDKMRKQAKLKLYERTDKGLKEVINHPLVEFTRMVNKNTDVDDFITAHLIYLLTIGEFFVYKPFLKTGANRGKTIEIYGLPSADVEIIEGTMFDPVKGYRIEGNYNVEFEANEVYHSKLFNPNAHEERNMHGLSPLRAAAKTVSKLNETEKTELKQLENQSPPYILFKEISSTGNAIDAGANRMTDIQRARYIKEIKQHADGKTRGLPYVAKDKMGKLDLGSGLSDLMTKELTESGAVALCNVYGLPPELFGYGQKTYNNLNTARKSAWTDCVIPYLGKVEQTYNYSFIYGIPEYQKYTYGFDYSDVEEMQEGFKEKVDWMTRAKWTGNEIRIATGKNPIDDDSMNQPIFSQSDILLDELSLDPSMKNQNLGDYKW